MQEKRRNMKMLESLNQCDGKMFSLLSNVAGCLALPVDEFVTVTQLGDGKLSNLSLLPLSANFGAATQTDISLLLSQSVTQKTKLELKNVFSYLKVGLKQKESEGVENGLPIGRETLINNLSFMEEMVSVLKDEIFNHEGELVVVIGEVSRALDLQVSGSMMKISDGKVEFNEKVDFKTQALMRKRAILLKAQNVSPKTVNMPNDDVGFLFHVIIPIKNSLEEDWGHSVQLQEPKWKKMLRANAAFSKIQEIAEDKVIGPGGSKGSHTSQLDNTTARGKRGFGRYSGKKK